MSYPTPGATMVLCLPAANLACRVHSQPREPQSASRGFLAARVRPCARARGARAGHRKLYPRYVSGGQFVRIVRIIIPSTQVVLATSSIVYRTVVYEPSQLRRALPSVGHFVSCHPERVTIMQPYFVVYNNAAVFCSLLYINPAVFCSLAQGPFEKPGHLAAGPFCGYHVGRYRDTEAGIAAANVGYSGPRGRASLLLPLPARSGVREARQALLTGGGRPALDHAARRAGLLHRPRPERGRARAVHRTAAA